MQGLRILALVSIFVLIGYAWYLLLST